MRSWFPRPVEETDLVLLDPSGTWNPAGVLALLTDAGAVEWRHKVGVTGPLDGSARTTTRLLLSSGWVCKTRVDQIFSSADAGRAWLAEARAPGRSAGLWHPDKVWGVLRGGDVWYPLTICREQRTLRQIDLLKDRLAAWIEMLQTSIDFHRLHRLGLDVNPSNFGWDPSTLKLHYLDEDVHRDGLGKCVLGGAIAARIPEEPAADVETWRRWGAALRDTICLGDFTWEELVHEIRGYPLPARYEERRAALVLPLTASAGRAPSRDAHSAEHGSAELTCVLADVHANLPALEAVLADASGRGATSFLFLGDAVGYGPHPLECVRRIAELPRAIMVRGNHDHAISTGRLDLGMNSLARECAAWTRAALGRAELAWLGELPIDHVGAGWMAVHGAPKDPMRFLAYVYDLTYEDNLGHLRERRIPICFHGHTHVQLAYVELTGGPSKLSGPRTFQMTPRNCWLVNPGSVGQPRDGDPRAAYAMWNRRTGELAMLRVAYDMDRALGAIRAAGLPARLEERLRAGT